MFIISYTAAKYIKSSNYKIKRKEKHTLATDLDVFKTVWPHVQQKKLAFFKEFTPTDRAYELHGQEKNKKSSTNSR